MALPVNIKVYTFCYNSEKILPFIINYWKQYATSVVVYDNMSTDKSVEILSKYDWIEVRHFDTNKKHDPDKMMQIKNNCVNESKSSKADYVMICDLDEVLYCYDSLMHDLAIAKQNGIKVFNSVYYNAIVNKFPASSLTLLQNISGVKLVKNINVNKVLLFDPSINIKFSNLQNNCTYDNNIKTGEINIIHNKMIGLDRFLNEQLDYIKRINKTNKYAMTYGASKNSCVAIFNNIYAKSFQPLYKAINQRIVLNNCKLPVLKTESKQVQTSNIIPETKNSTFNFTDIKWKPAKIQYNTPACGNKDLVIVIPVYKTDLDKYEQMSLQRLSLVIKTSFDIVLVMPEGLNIESYNNIYPGKINTLALNKQYFCNRKGYSYLCETTLFYECFSDYKFMLIYQLDGWIFKNDLNRFIKMDYDYIGAPWKQSLAIPRTVGNGGVSLRKISKFIEICKWLDPKDINEKYAAQIEDIFFCLYVKKKLKDKFNIAPVNVGLDFCIDKNPTYWMSESKGKLPMCVHAFQKHYSYWEDKFNNADIKQDVKKPILLTTINNSNNMLEGVSICVSAYKAQKYIKETLDSIKKQTWFKKHNNWECLIGIDGCQETYDYILTIINEYDSDHFKFYMMDSNKGTYVTSNTLMANISKYKWLIRFDADDIMRPNLVETIMSEKKNYDYIRFLLQNFITPDYKNGTIIEKDSDKSIYISCGLLLINKKIFLDFGGYRDWKCNADAEFSVRIRKFVPKKDIKKVLFDRRISPTSLTRDESTNYKSDIRKLYTEITNKEKTTIKNVKDATIIMKTNTYKEIINKPLITFIIPSRGEEQLRKVINNIKYTYRNENIKVVCITLTDNNVFRKGQLYNIAFKKFPNSDYYVLYDNDIISLRWIDIIGEYKKFGKPYCAFTHITQLNYINDSEYKITISEERPYGFGAFVVLKKDDIEKSNGFSNLCFGWGAEDLLFSVKNNNFARLSQDLGHITHDRRVNLNPDFTKNNSKYLKLYRDKKINSSFDGYRQTIYNISFEYELNNTYYIGANNIGVVKDYKYNNYYNEQMVLYNKKYIPNEKQLIISLTSYPKRIKYVQQVLESIIRTSVNKALYRIVLVLSTEEFPKKYQSLPWDLVNYCFNNNIEILWTPKNTRSHKKLIPTIQKYPNNDILVIDDDIIRNTDWLQMFLDDRKKYPNDILCMRCDYEIDKNLKTVHNPKAFDKIKPDDLIYNCRPANGCGGVLYPAKTFTEKEFFDDSIYMLLTPSSDEMWQWCFNIKNNLNIRKTSKFFKFTSINGTQEQSLFKENRDKYTLIMNKLFEKYPTFKKNLKTNILK